MSGPTQENRCTGHCCSKFYLPFKDKEALARGAKNAEDFEYIYDMVIKLPEQAEDGEGIPIPEGEDRRYHWWTCKHHDTKTGDCTAYDKRPSMCSGYPYGGPCLMKGCTADCAKPKWEAANPMVAATQAAAKAATSWSCTVKVHDVEVEAALKEIDAEFKRIKAEAPRKVTRDDLFTSRKSGNRK